MSARLTARGWTVLVLGALLFGAGVWAGYPGVTGLGCALLVLTVASVAVLLLPAPVAVRREVGSERVERLTDCAGTLHVRNRSPWLPVRLDGEDAVDGVPVRVAVPALAPGASVQVPLTVPTLRRGVITLGPLRLRRQGLVGLAQTTTELPDRHEVTVVPRVLALRGMPTGTRRSHAGTDEQVERGGTDLVGLHEYVAGDDLRRLHWASSARTGTLMIRDDADPGLPHLTVVLDDRAASYSDDGFEEAADLAATVIATAAADGYPARLLSAGAGVDVDVPAGPPSGVGGVPVDLVTAPVQDALAGIAPRTTDPDAAADSAVGPEGLRGSDIVVVVSGDRAALPSLLLDAGRSGTGVVAVVDPHTSRLADVLGGVVLLRGPRAEDLVTGWDLAVLR